MKIKPKGRKSEKVVTLTNEHGKKSKNVDLSTLSIDEFLSSAFDESGDSDIGGVDNASNLLSDTTLAMNGDRQEKGMHISMSL
jgi:hypothetical protein